jgi:hypothetical protein
MRRFCKIKTRMREIYMVKNNLRRKREIANRVSILEKFMKVKF